MASIALLAKQPSQLTVPGQCGVAISSIRRLETFLIQIGN
jgi:hypothetical protein